VLSLAVAAMAGRIALLGFEKIVFKRLGTGRDSLAVLFLVGFAGSLMLLPFAFGEKVDSWSFLPVAAVSAVVYLSGITLYVKALSEGEVSLVSPVYSFNVFFLLVLSVLFLGESFSAWKIGGLSLMVAGSAFLNRTSGWAASLKSLCMDRACRVMIGASLLIAVGRVIDARIVGLVAENPPTVAYAVVQSAFMALFAFAALVSRGKGKLPFELFRERPWSALGAVACNIYAYLLLLFALRGIEVSLAEPLSMLATLISVILARFMFREAIRDRLVGATVMIGGAWLMFL
jgi:transporter family protein